MSIPLSKIGIDSFGSNWIKFKSGHMLQWFKTEDSAAVSGTWAQHQYCSSTTVNLGNFPEPFIESPFVMATNLGASNGSRGNISGHTAITSTDAGTIYLQDGTRPTGYYWFSFRVFAFGKWK